MLSLVIPKGSLERATLDLFDAADLTVRRSSERDYHAVIDDPRIDRVRFLRPQEIPSYVEQGLFDFGITGRDWITETGADVASLGELQYSKATSEPVRVVLAVPASVPWQSAADLPEGVRISTEFPGLTRRYLEARGVKAVVIPSYGATEAKVPDIVDAIVDLTETGASLVRNGLRILDTLLTSYTELIANHQSCADAAKRDAMEDIALLLRGAIQARGSVLLKLNVSAADLPEGVRISTEFPSLTRRFLEAHGVKATVVPSYGATEAKVPDIVDAIVDLTETGSSLRRNGLRVLDTVVTSYTELVANAEAYEDEGKRAAMEDIALLLRGAIQARGNVLLKLNVAADRLEEVAAMLPAMSSPTITTLARGQMNAVETVVPKAGVNTLIPALKAAGARDILEIPISKIVE